mmetsp:Transcript_12593/g.18100  ORF Transcript_12593/g.18100 Transcript_12593/m.18100 type:complete len:87 (+) Transcript_12593:1447-1707(+)
MIKPEKDIQKEIIWSIRAYSDSDYSGDTEKRLSITGFIIFVMGVPVSWKSCAQRSVTISSTEAEYVALSETCAEIMFIRQVLECMG